MQTGPNVERSRSGTGTTYDEGARHVFAIGPAAVSRARPLRRPAAAHVGFTNGGGTDADTRAP
ncbi:hypothetical protein, partial [Streptomyces hydrogenans]